ncbi:LexA family transcriptional regulator [Bacillus thuringiensis]|uniref:LexA family transcriptional regulator n=1 Tax=Bacillus thuringiensis TaxID=1428 RepID=UPI002175ABF8|nr:LexA family transcriptional regulator [Bacillus thuringiensis]
MYVISIQKYEKIIQNEHFTKIGIARSTLSDYMNYRAKPSSGVLEKMATVFGVTKSDIDTTYKNSKVEIVDGELQLVQEKPTDNESKKEIPIIGKIAAGVPLEAVQDIVDRIAPPYKTHNIDELFGLVVNGESMNKIVPNGHYAVLKKQPDVQNGEIAAVIVNGHYATLKKVYKFTDLMILEPCSHDESFKDQQYSQDNCEDIKIIGKFLYSVSPIIQ